MPRNYFITGQPKTGKTTLLKELVAELKNRGLRVGGFVSPEERHHGTRTAFQVMDVESGKKAQLASVGGDGPKVSKYHVDVRSFESIAVPAMERYDSYDVFVIDEIGVMEMKSDRFSRLLERILDSDTPLVATLNERYINTYTGDGEVVDLDNEDREQAFLRLLRSAKENIQRKPAKAEKKEAKPAPKPAPKKAAKKAGKEKPSIAKKEKAKPKQEKEEKPPKKEERMEEAPAEHHKKEPEKKEGIFGRIKKIFGG